MFAKEAASAGAKLLCFPEAFSFVGALDGDSVRIAQPLDGPIMHQYCSLARCYCCSNMFSLFSVQIFKNKKQIKNNITVL